MEKNKVMLDTSAYSAYLRGNEDVKRAVQEADEVYLNPVVMGELYAGFAHGGKEKKNREILREFLASPRVQVAVIDEETSERYAAIIAYLFLLPAIAATVSSSSALSWRPSVWRLTETSRSSANRSVASMSSG